MFLGRVMAVVMVAHRFATGLPCRASSHAASAMLASLRVAGGRGCGSRPFGRASLARAWPHRRDHASWSRKGRDVAGSAQSQTLAPARRPDRAALAPGFVQASSSGHDRNTGTRSTRLAGAALQFTRRASSPIQRRSAPHSRDVAISLSDSPIMANRRLRASRHGGDRVAGSRIRMVADAPCESGLLRCPHHSPPLRP